jgi:DNA gyrase subunit B
MHSYVNNINTHEGGTHLAGFRSGLTRTLKKYADNSGATNKLKFEIAGDDFREGLTCVISVKVQEPQFEGQTKTKLGNNEVMGAVNVAVSEMLENYLEEHPQGCPPDRGQGDPGRHRPTRRAQGPRNGAAQRRHERHGPAR